MKDKNKNVCPFFKDFIKNRIILDTEEQRIEFLGQLKEDDIIYWISYHPIYGLQEINAHVNKIMAKKVLLLKNGDSYNAEYSFDYTKCNIITKLSIDWFFIGKSTLKTCNELDKLRDASRFWKVFQKLGKKLKLNSDERVKEYKKLFRAWLKFEKTQEGYL